MAGQDAEAIPWHELDPWDHVRCDDGNERDGPDCIPPVLGPAPRFRAPLPNPWTVEAPGLDLPGPSLAAQLCWKVSRRPRP